MGESQRLDLLGTTAVWQRRHWRSFQATLLPPFLARQPILGHRRCAKQESRGRTPAECDAP